LSLRPDRYKDRDGRERGPELIGVHVQRPSSGLECMAWFPVMTGNGIRQRLDWYVAGAVRTAGAGRAQALSRSVGRGRNQARGGWNGGAAGIPTRNVSAR